MANEEKGLLVSFSLSALSFHPPANQKFLELSPVAERLLAGWSNLGLRLQLPGLYSGAQQNLANNVPAPI